LARGSRISRDPSADFDIVYDTFRVNNNTASRFPKAFRRVYDEVHHDLLTLRGISPEDRRRETSRARHVRARLTKDQPYPCPVETILRGPIRLHIEGINSGNADWEGWKVPAAPAS
jgi:hypothetical protein